MFTKPHITFFLLIIAMVGCNQNKSLQIEVFETSADGNKLTKISEFPTSDSIVEIQLNPKEKYQKITWYEASPPPHDAKLSELVTHKSAGNSPLVLRSCRWVTHCNIIDGST